MYFTVADVLPEVRRIVGKCSTSVLYTRLSDAVDVLSKTGEFDLLSGFVDVCVDCHTFALPSDIGTILTINVGGRPSMGRDMYHQFHLNGPGSEWRESVDEWHYLGRFPTYRELSEPSKLVAHLAHPDDEGAELWAYGYDVNNNVIRTKVGGSWVTGYQIPTVYGMAVPDVDAPVFARVTALRKTETKQALRVQSFDASATTGTLLAVMQWHETTPSFQRIRISPDAGWARVGYKKQVFRVQTPEDIIALPSLPAVTMMVEAMKWYSEGDLARGAGFEATARRLLTEAEHSTTPPLSAPIQVHPHTTMFDAGDHID